MPHLGIMTIPGGACDRKRSMAILLGTIPTTLTQKSRYPSRPNGVTSTTPDRTISASLVP